jgi:hypothetical protein
MAHWDGSEWLLFPAPPAEWTVTSLWPRSQSDIWAVARTGAVWTRVLLHYDGVAWQRPPDVVNEQEPLWIWSSGDEAFIYGTARNEPGDGGLVTGGVLLKWAGTSWVDDGRAPDGGEFFVGPAPGALWTGLDWGSPVTTDAMVSRFDGSVWSLIPPPNFGVTDPGLIEAGSETAWSPSPDELWVPAQRHMLHFDGTDWSAIAIAGVEGNPNQRWSGMWGSSPIDIWAIGDVDGYSGGVPGGDPVIAHWDGASWTACPSSEGVGGLTVIAGSAANDVWAAGPSSVIHYGPLH